VSEAATLTTGDLVAERYRIEAEAGRGGFAIAYEALDTQTGETVAVKVPNLTASSNDASVVEEYFLKEATALERIRDVGGHPNVMNLIERLEAEDTPVLVVEFVDGYELDDAIDRMGPRDPAEVREVGIGLCEAMSFLHEHEIVYRDLKPDNIMIAQRNGTVTPVLIDFNTATKFDAEGTAEDSGTTILGPYKPREVAEANRSEARQGPWSDVYSIGKILLFLLRGTVPKKDGVDPREFGVECPSYLAAIVECATQSAYEDRYHNATAMRRVLTDMDPTPPPQASVRHLQTDDRYTIHVGDTIGRADAPGPSPAVAIRDGDEYISTVQVQFDVDEAGNWILLDRSLNGTYVQSGNGWQRVLGEAGRERLREQGEDPTDRDGNVPPTTVTLQTGDLISLVHPSYGVSFEFHQH
jgi:protein kinase/serine/threonine-protein kinase